MIFIFSCKHPEDINREIQALILRMSKIQRIMYFVVTDDFIFHMFRKGKSFYMYDVQDREYCRIVIPRVIPFGRFTTIYTIHRLISKFILKMLIWITAFYFNSTNEVLGVWFLNPIFYESLSFSNVIYTARFHIFDTIDFIGPLKAKFKSHYHFSHRFTGVVYINGNNEKTVIIIPWGKTLRSRLYRLENIYMNLLSRTYDS